VVTLVRTLISGANVQGGGVSTFAFEDPVSDAAATDLLAELQVFWGDVSQMLDEDVTLTMEDNPAQYVASTGVLQNVYSATAPAAVTGVQPGDSVPRASQALIRWATAEIINGRRLRGRTFIPGITSTLTTDAGGLDGGAVAQLAQAANDFIDAAPAPMVVWHRPVNGAGGSTGLVTIASVWDQFAVLRSRRD